MLFLPATCRILAEKILNVLAINFTIMASLKLTIDYRQQYKDGRSPVIFRLTSKTKSTFIHSDLKVFPVEWDRDTNLISKKHPEYKSLNVILRNRQLDLEKRLLILGSEADNYPLQELKSLLVDGNTVKQTTFWEFATKEIQALQMQEKFGNAQAYETALNRLIKFTGKDITLDKIDYAQDGRIVYKRRKTGKIYSIRITMEAERILNIYRTGNSKYLIPMGLDDIPKNQMRKTIALRLKTCNKYLKRLGKKLELPIPLTTYVARYSWANVAKSLGYSKDLIAEALGHEYGNRVTGIYLDNYGSEVIDEMNEKVTGD